MKQASNTTFDGKQIWLRTSAYIPEPMNVSNSGVSVVFYHLFATMRSMGINVVRTEPSGVHLELWWGWDASPSTSKNPKALFTLGETGIEYMAHWDEFDHIFVVTRYGKERQRVPKPLSVWPLGVDTAMFPVLARSNAAFTFSHVGTPQYRKGSDLLCKAFADEFKHSKDVRLSIIASQGGGDMYEPLQAKYSDCPNIVFSASFSNRQEMWKNYTGDCLAFPSLREGWGLCLTEAMATGMSAIVSRLPVFDGIFNDDCGWWIDMDTSVPGVGYGVPSEESLKQRMIYAYEHQDEVILKGNNAAKLVRHNLTWERGITDGFLPVAKEYGWV